MIKNNNPKPTPNTNLFQRNFIFIKKAIHNNTRNCQEIGFQIQIPYVINLEQGHNCSITTITDGPFIPVIKNRCENHYGNFSKRKKTKRLLCFFFVPPNDVATRYFNFYASPVARFQITGMRFHIPAPSATLLREHNRIYIPPSQKPL